MKAFLIQQITVFMWGRTCPNPTNKCGYVRSNLGMYDSRQWPATIQVGLGPTWAGRVIAVIPYLYNVV